MSKNSPQKNPPKLIDRVEEMRARGQRFFNRALNNRLAFSAAGDETVIEMYDEIGFYGITAQQIRARLNAISTPTIRLRINSPGGDVFDGFAIYNDLKDHPAKVVVDVVGLAASAASIIAMAGDEIHMADNSFMMIHNAWTLAIGDKHALDDVAEILSQIDDAIAATYAKKTGISHAAIVKMMDDETWLGAEEAREKGFADPEPSENEDTEVAALFDLTAFAKVPAALKQQVERGLRDAGCSRREARAATADGFGKFGRRDAAGRDEGRDAATAETVAELKALAASFKSSTAA